ncbi:MAG TPA: hypothetical protein VGG53_20560 [Mycobacterium sp.]|jgi:hypothetical protein|uniref:hypothetical protein n=1 Tax=Mycobacterium sp. TaxID=1785 RepID=UPI002F41E091
MSHSELLPIPPIQTACDPVHSIDDLRQRWRALMGPLGFGTRLLWFGLIGPDRCFGQKISRVALRPRPRGPVVWNLMSSLRTLLDDLEPGTTVALLLSGPGRGPTSTIELMWSKSLTDMAARLSIPLEPIFRANDVSVALLG